MAVKQLTGVQVVQITVLIHVSRKPVMLPVVTVDEDVREDTGKNAVTSCVVLTVWPLTVTMEMGRAYEVVLRVGMDHSVIILVLSTV